MAEALLCTEASQDREYLASCGGWLSVLQPLYSSDTTIDFGL